MLVVGVLSFGLSKSSEELHRNSNIELCRRTLPLYINCLALVNVEFSLDKNVEDETFLQCSIPTELLIGVRKRIYWTS